MATTFGPVKAVLFDMDGVLYDSMPGHALAWKQMCDSVGIVADANEFFAYEGRTGASTINLLFERQYGHGADEETCRRLYEIKSRNFKALGEPCIMPGARETVAAVTRNGVPCVLVTGSGQASILERLDRDYNGDIYVNNGALRVRATDDFFIGSIFPKANMGWNTHLGWKGLDLGFTVAARLGGIVLSATESYLDQFGVSERSARSRDEGGIPVNQGSVSAESYYKAIAGNAAFYTYDATNVRLQEMSLNYTLPQKWFHNKAKLTLGIVGHNLWMIYCKAPFDPEVSAEVTSNSYQGFDSFMLPSTRNIGFNVKLQF